ncbi:hypothetical protein CY34DRAFT_783964 [Suillus luteus UH-Slu-Lm8-n1]|uniref:Uncharacterized protein n=1 Tax=Suillus luteus UH-Slu-Lm8-n1 TaxID=930992 RepID=A0A0D0B445_9AGAM|nr:hypothetical protein CY34DRAFT_783964 [Suillus luteus UH-Slu-Lm8-n1]
MSQPCDLQVVAVAHRPALRERVGQPLSTPALAGYPTSVHASRPLRSSPLAGPAFSSNPSILSSESSRSHSPSTFSLDVGPYSRSPPSSVISHNGSISATTSSHAHRAPGSFTGPSKSAGSIPSFGLDARPYSRSPPSSVISHTGSASSSSFSSHAHRASTAGPAKSTSAIPTLSLFRRQAKDEPAAPLPTQAPFGHSRSASFPCQTDPPPAHVPQAYSPSVARPTSPKSPVSRNPNDNWMSSTPFGPASTPRFSRQSMSSQPVVMPLSAREYRRRKCASTITNATYSPRSGSPANESMGIEGVNSLPHIIVSDSEVSGPMPSVPPSGNRSSRRASSPSLPSSRVSHVSREPALSEKSSISTFLSLSSENEAENAVTVVDPGITPRRRKSYPNPTQHHPRISLVGAANRLSQMSVASGDTVFFDMDNGRSPRQRQNSVTEDDGVLRRASSRRKKFDPPSHEPLMADAAAEPAAPQERTRVVRILEANEDSSIPVLDSRFSNATTHDREELVSGDIFTERPVSSESKVLDLKAPGTSPVAKPRKKLTKSRAQSVQVPPTRLATPSLPWIPRPPSPFFRGSAKQNVSTSDEENVPQTEENGKENKRRGHRLTFQFIPSPSFHRRPKSASGAAPSLDLKSPMRNDTRERIPKPDSLHGTDGALSSLTGSATTITLLPPPPITSSSSVSSSAGNSTTSLTDGSSTTMGSRDTSATSVNTLTLQTPSRGAEYSYPKVPSNLKQSMVAQCNSDTDSDQQGNSTHASKTFADPPNASHDQELQESSSSFCTVTSYASLASYATSGSAPALDATNAPDSFCDRDQVPDSNVHPMWTVPMVTVTAASSSAPPLRAKEIPPILHNPHARPSFLAVPVPVPASRSTARLKRPRPRPQTAPASPTAPHFPISPTTKSPRATGASSGFKSMLRSLLGRAG